MTPESLFPWPRSSSWRLRRRMRRGMRRARGAKERKKENGKRGEKRKERLYIYFFCAGRLLFCFFMSYYNTYVRTALFYCTHDYTYLLATSNNRKRSYIHFFCTITKYTMFFFSFGAIRGGLELNYFNVHTGKASSSLAAFPVITAICAGFADNEVEEI